MAISLGDIKKKKIKIEELEDNFQNDIQSTTSISKNENGSISLGDINSGKITVKPLEETNHAQNYNLNGTKKLAPISKSIINGINNRGIKERLNTTLENLSQIPLSTSKEKIDLSGKSYFKDTGKTYGDYYYDNYAQNKNKKIYINTNDKKYYINTNGKYQRLNKLDENGNIISDDVMTTTEIEKQKKQEAIRQGYKDNSSNKITSQEYDNAQSTE